ncbi:TolC family protein [Pseudorhodoferax sp. LjRoot39]|uniref:TolC family protein n=1 Tax=Pseudorhodoferax sp. LjRoot39 TaxID=3342328 RepID=UPI003ECCD72F
MCRFSVPLAFALTAFASASVLAQSVGTSAAPVSVAQASSAPPLTLAAAVQTALQNHPDLSAARREIEATEGARTQAAAYQNPSLSVEVEDLRRDTRTTTVMWSQPFELGGKRGARIAAADRATELARAQLDAKQAELRANVTAAFFTSLIAQERVRLAQASLDLARTGTQTGSKRVISGKVSPVEETRAKVAEANVRLELIQAQGELQNSLQELRSLMAQASAVSALDGNALTLPALLPQEALEQRIADAPALRQARLEVRRLAALADLESAKRVPDITVNAGIKRAQDQGRNQAVIGISIPLPVFDTNRGAIFEALRRQDKAEDEARAIELRLRADVAVARERQATASAEVAAVQAEILPGAQSAFDAASKGFELGKFDYLEALDAQRSLLQARAQYLRSVAEAHRAATDLDRLLGVSVSIP